MIKWQIRELTGRQYIYVDKAGDDTAADAYWVSNPASVSNRSTPYITITAAINAMNTEARFTTNNVNLIIGNGVWQETIPTTRSKGNVTWWGNEATSFLYNNAASCILTVSDAIINNIKFSEGSVNRVISTASAAKRQPIFRNCSFDGFVSTKGILAQTFGSLGATFENCVITDSWLSSNGANAQLYDNVFKNCVLRNVSFSEISSQCRSSILSLENSQIKNLSQKFAVSGTFDFCNLEGTVSIGTIGATAAIVTGDQTAIAAAGYNVNGQSVDANTVAFNDPANGDYTQKSASPFLLAGKEGANIGPRSRGFYTSAADFFNNALSVSGFSLVNNRIVQDAVAVATIEGAVIDLVTDTRLGYLRLGAILGYDVAGKLQQTLQESTDVGEGGRGLVVCEFKAWKNGDVEPASYRKLNVNQRIFEDDAGNAPADAAVNLDQFNSIVARYVRLKITGYDSTI